MALLGDRRYGVRIGSLIRHRWGQIMPQDREPAYAPYRLIVFMVHPLCDACIEDAEYEKGVKHGHGGAHEYLLCVMVI